MKKRVRIYKPENLNTFQTGGQQGDVNSQVLNYILQAVSAGSSLDEVSEQLVQSGIPAPTVNQLVNQVNNYIEEQSELQVGQAVGDEKAAQEAQYQAEEEARIATQQEAEDRAARMQEMYMTDDTNPNATDDDSEAYMKYGGVSKKKFIADYVKLAKKQEGGDTDLTTDIPINGRNEQLNKFIGAVKETANTAALREQAEQAYEQQMQMFAQDGGELPEAQFGGGLFHGRHGRRAARQLNRMMPEGMPNQSLMQFMPQNSFPGGVTLANIDVRRTGLFGKPKEYTINFNTTPINFNTIKDIAELEENNAKETHKDVEKEVKSTETNTSTDKNAVVTAEVEADPITFSTGNKVTEEVSAKSTTVKPGKKTVSTAPVIPTAADYAPAPFEDVLRQKYDYSTYNTGKPTKVSTPKVPASSNYFEKSPWAYRSIKSQQAPAPAKTSSPWDRELENRYLNQQRMHFQQGGFTDEQSGLYKFFGGGEDPSIPQLDIDYTDSKNTADPYFAYGGLTQYQTAGTTPKVDYTINPVTGKAWTDEEWKALTQKKEDIKTLQVGDYRGDLINPATGKPYTYEEWKTSGMADRGKNRSPFSPEQEAWFQQHYGNTGQQQTGYPQVAYSGYNPYLSAVAPGFFGGNRPVQYAGSWAKMIGAPYMTGTDNPAMNLMGPNTRISSIDVKKTGMLSHRPKKYTVNFTNYLDNTAPTFTDKPGPGVSSQAGDNDRVVRRREAIREADQYINKLDAEPTKEDQTLAFSPNEAIKPDEFAKLQEAQTARPGMTDEEIAMSSPPDNSQPLDLSMSDKRNLRQGIGYSTGDIKNIDRSAANTISNLELQERNLAKQNRQQAVDKFGNMLDWAQNESAIQEQMPRESNMLLRGDHQYNPMEHIQTGAFTPGYDLPDMEHYNSDNDIRLREMQNRRSNQPSKRRSNANVNDNSSQENITFNKSKQVSNISDEDFAKENPNSLAAMNKRQRDFYNSPEGRAAVKAMKEKAAADKAKGRYYIEPSGSAIKIGNEGDYLGAERARQRIEQLRAVALARNEAIIRKHSKKDSSGLLSQKSYGGLPESAEGEEVKVYTSRPEYAGISNVEMTQRDVAPNLELNQSNMQMPSFGSQDFATSFNGIANVDNIQDSRNYGRDLSTHPSLTQTDPTAAATMNTTIDPNQANRDTLKKSTKEQKWSADFKTKNAWNVDFPELLNKFNAAANTGLGWIENAQNNKANNEQLAAYMSDNLNAANARRNRGSFDVNSGLEDPDKMGFTGVAAYGGMFQDGGYYDQNDEVYMTEDEIKDFLANGGELEYIND